MNGVMLKNRPNRGLEANKDISGVSHDYVCRRACVLQDDEGARVTFSEENTRPWSYFAETTHIEGG